MKALLLSAVAFAGLVAAHQAEAGSIIISGPGLAGGLLTATSAAGATTAPFMLGDFGNSGTNGLVSTGTVQLANGGSINFTPDGSTPQGGIYDGNVTNVSASPFNGTGLGQQNYLAAQPNDPVTINLGSNPADPLFGAYHSFSLLWGTVDSYNTLNLDFRAGSVSLFNLSITGDQVAKAIGNGFQANGSTPAFVTLSFETPGFNQVVATSTQSAFEFDPSVQVPEPASMAMLGAGLVGMGFVRRRKA